MTFEVFVGGGMAGPAAAAPSSSSSFLRPRPAHDLLDVLVHDLAALIAVDAVSLPDCWSATSLSTNSSSSSSCFFIFGCLRLAQAVSALGARKQIKQVNVTLTRCHDRLCVL